MAITKEKWKELEIELGALWVSVKFQYKGAELAIQRQRKSESTSVLTVFVDGTVKPSWGWFREDVEDRPPFIKEIWKLSTRAKYRRADVKELEKIYGKRRAKKEYPDLHKRHEYWLPYFSKASVLCKQFKKLEGITLIEDESLES